MGKRLVRAKEKIREAGIPFAIPERAELPVRLDAVLDAIYAGFSEGWSDPSATDISRRDLTEETLFLARLVVELLPNEAEALGLLALMLHAEARRFARRTCADEYVPLSKQDMRLWDAEMIREAEGLLLRASELGVMGRFQLEGALQSAHVHRRRTGAGNWREVVQLYDALLAVSGSPVVGINRALALAEVNGAGAGLCELDNLAKDTRLGEYQPYWAARAELLTRAGDYPEAKRSYELAIGLEREEAVRRFLLQQAAGLPE
jgi:RNA polymerase sigma-70 factor (ECF subfamily)